MIDSTKAKEMERMIESARQIILTCHVRPDGDAIGSTLALWNLFKTKGKNSTVVVPDKPPMNLSFLPGFREIGIYTSHKDYCEKSVEEADLIICCDFNTPTRLDSLSDVIVNSKAKKILIDHHTEPSDFADLMISYPGMSATCELVFRLIAAMGWYSDVNQDCATCMLTGIITDTRNFSVNVKNPDIYDILMRLLEKDVDKEKIVRESLISRSLNSLRLESYAIYEKMQIFPEHKAAIVSLNEDELKRFDYERGDTEGLVNRPLEIRGIVYSIFLREDPDCIKISARSKDGFPVSEICKTLFGGGGHLQAAGAEFHGTLEECKDILIENMNKFDKYLNPK